MIRYRKSNYLLEADTTDTKSIELKKLYDTFNNFAILTDLVNYCDELFEKIPEVKGDYKQLITNLINAENTYNQTTPELTAATWQRWVKNVNNLYVAHKNLFDAIAKEPDLAKQFQNLDKIQKLINIILERVNLKTFTKFDQINNTEEKTRIAKLIAALEDRIFAEGNNEVLLSQIEGPVSETKEAYKQYDKITAFEKWFKDSWKNFKNNFLGLNIADEDINQLKKLINDLRQQKASLKNLKFPDKNKFNESNFINDLTDILKKINTTLADIAQVLAKIQETQLQTTNDWQARFREAAKKVANGQSKTAIQDTWTEYYKEEWPKFDRRLLAEIGKPFTSEINTYGFSILHNPFISYLKRMQQKPGFIEALTKNVSAYFQIHNAVSRDILNEHSLRGTSVVGLKNIIFSLDFYNKTTDDIPKYLDAQKRVIGIISKANFDGFAHSFLNDEYKVANKEALQQFFVDLFYENSNLYAGPVTKRIHGSSNKNLQSIERIQNTINLCFTPAQLAEYDTEAAEDIAKPITETEFETIFRKFNRQILGTATKAQVLGYRKSLKDFYKEDGIAFTDPFNQLQGLPEPDYNTSINKALNKIGYKLPKLNELNNDKGILRNIVNKFLDKLCDAYKKL